MRIPVLTPAQAAEWDRRAASAGIRVETLMDAAGRASAAVLAARHGPALRGGVLVAAGPGNNGGDGWALARALHHLAVPVWVTQLAGRPSPPNQQARVLALADGVREVEPEGPWPSVTLAVDAILGTGATGAPRPAAAALLERLRDLRVPVVALDGPTGVDLLTGAVWGTAGATLSITFGAPRRGHLIARDEVGDIAVVDIGLPPPDPSWPVLVTDAATASWLAPFPARAHKGTRGRVVAVGGDAGMSGALRLAGRAAFCAVGAGLVFRGSPRGHRRRAFSWRRSPTCRCGPTRSRAHCRPSYVTCWRRPMPWCWARDSAAEPIGASSGNWSCCGPASGARRRRPRRLSGGGAGASRPCRRAPAPPHPASR